MKKILLSVLILTSSFAIKDILFKPVPIQIRKPNLLNDSDKVLYKIVDNYKYHHKSC